jgi:hypothetical protein
MHANNTNPEFSIGYFVERQVGACKEQGRAEDDLVKYKVG